jgi:hypothetical protein
MDKLELFQEGIEFYRYHLDGTNHDIVIMYCEDKLGRPLTEVELKTLEYMIEVVRFTI